MYKKIRAVFSIALILSVLTCQFVFADNVYIAGAPTNNLASTTGLAGSSVLGTMQSAQGVQGIYPGSIDGHDQPTTVNITSPKANITKLASATGTNQRSNVITNGYAIPVETNYATPVTKDITSPAAHQAGLRNGTDGYSYGPNNMKYVEPTSTNTNGTSNYPYNGGTSGGSTSLTEKKTGLPDPVITSDAAIIINGNTNEYYYQKNALTPVPPAGLTTLLTGYIALQSKSANDVLTVSQSAVTGLESGANTISLRAGDTITLKDAILAMYIKSACDAANVIAENVSGSQEAFVNLMNQTAKSWGTVSTNFVNCNGLNNDNQFTTAYDMAIIMNNVITNEGMVYALSQSKYTLPATAHRKALTITSKNSIIVPGSSNYYAGIACSRYGYTSKAKHTLASAMVYNNQKIIAVLLHSNGSHFVDNKRLFNFGKAVVDSLGLNQSGSAAIASTNAGISTGTGTAQATGASGDTAGTWQKDATGWMFIKADGTKAINQWVQTGGKRYCIDQTGYMITGWRQFSNGSIYYFDAVSGDQKFNIWINTTNGAYFLKPDGTLAKAPKGQTETISTPVGNYTIDENGKAIQKVS